MIYLVTGAAGFLGSHLVEKLLLDGHQVIGLDNLYTGSLKNLEPFLSNNNFSFVEHDVENELDLEIDGIFNLACPASPIHYQINPVKTIRTNIIGSINMLDLARKYNAKILQASTSEIYGDPLLSPQKESYWGNVNPIGVRSCYDEGKRASETLFFDYHREYNIEIKVARIFNTYGPRMHFEDGRVVSNFMLQALNNEPITIYGDGSQTRSFCYVSDLISGLVRLMDSPREVTGPINLGNPVEFNMVQLAEKIIEITGSKSKLVFKNLPLDDPKQRKPSIELANKLLSWEPTIDLNQGLVLMLEDFKSRL